MCIKIKQKKQTNTQTLKKAKLFVEYAHTETIPVRGDYMCRTEFGVVWSV